jgi:NAD+ kinase
MDWAAQSDTRIVARAQDAGRVPDRVVVVSDAEFVEQVDGIVSLGGDGTMLGAMRLMAHRPVPVLGVNHGNLGFLVEVQPEQLIEALERMRVDEYSIEPHHGLVVTIRREAAATGQQTGEQGGERGPEQGHEQGREQGAEQAPEQGAESLEFTAFNDFVLVRRPGHSVVNADLWLGGAQYGYYKCDAVVVATPAGSTAYNLAAGGPVISPATVASVITPVAPMAGISRAVVLGAQEVIELRIPNSAADIAVEVDGLVSGMVGRYRVITIQLREDAGLVVRFDANRHAQRGRVKLSLLDLPLRPDQLLDLVPTELRQRVTDLRDGIG